MDDPQAQDTVETLQHEIAALRQRVADLEQQVATCNEQAAVLTDLLDQAPAGIFVKHADGRYLLINHITASFLRNEPHNLLGKSDQELFPAKTVERWRTNDQPVLEEGKHVQVETVIHHDDGLRTYLTTRFPLSNDEGTIYAIGGISIDITERSRTEAAQAIWHMQLKEAQQSLIHELSAPIMPISDEILVLSLVGEIDEVRSQHIQETFLNEIARTQATTAIVDLTGVKSVDSLLVQMLGDMCQAADLLGTRAIVTGIDPSRALALLKHSQNHTLKHITTFASLKRGIADALRTTTHA